VRKEFLAAGTRNYLICDVPGPERLGAASSAKKTWLV